jgi:hypothetical protein
MIRFLGKILIFSIFPLGTLLGVFLMENGKADPFYLRFASPKQNSLVIGNSKAAQGIIPDLINKQNPNNEFGKLYNYSFTINHSPFGPAYLTSIQNKLSEDSSKGYFIVTVDPWSLSGNIENPENPDLFTENNGFMGNLLSFSSSPNLQYLLKWFEKPYYEILLIKLTKAHSILHDDGWYETGQSMNADERKNFMIGLYSDLLQESAFSETRFKSFESTVKYLSDRGKVILVRMPIHEDIYKVEKNLVPDFDHKVEFIAKQNNIPYYNYSSDERWEFKDGVHLTKESAKEFSNHLAEKILFDNEN